MVSARDWVSPPTFEPLSYRLTDMAEQADFGGHAKLGVMFTPDFCGPLLNVSATCVTGGPTLAPIGGIPSRGTDPFLTYAWLSCDFIGEGYDEMKNRTREALARNAPTAVEQVFWSGTVSGGPAVTHLAANTPVVETSGGSTVNLQTAATVITGGPFTPTVAISKLEQAMAGCYGGSPFIHVQRGVTPFLSERMLVTARGSRLVTDNGSIVVPGAGYAGTAPDGSAPAAGSTWVYATGKVKYWKSDIDFTSLQLSDALYRPTNSNVLIAKQWWMLGWDCCHFAIQMSLTGLS